MQALADPDYLSDHTIVHIRYSRQELRNAPKEVREMMSYADTPEAPVWEKLAALTELARATAFTDGSTG